MQSATMQSEDLWEHAYQSVKDHNHPPFWSPDRIQFIAERKLNAHDASKLVIRLGHASTKVRQQWDNIVKFRNCFLSTIRRNSLGGCIDSPVPVVEFFIAK